MGLADNKCIPCRGGVPPVPNDRTEALLKELGRGWSLDAQGHLERLYTFKDFAQALAYVNKVGAIAEVEGHHPDLYLAWGSQSRDLDPQDQRPHRERLLSGGQGGSGIRTVSGRS